MHTCKEYFSFRLGPISLRVVQNTCKEKRVNLQRVGPQQSRFLRAFVRDPNVSLSSRGKLWNPCLWFVMRKKRRGSVKIFLSESKGIFAWFWPSIIAGSTQQQNSTKALATLCDIWEEWDGNVRAYPRVSINMHHCQVWKQGVHLQLRSVWKFINYKL